MDTKILICISLAATGLLALIAARIANSHRGRIQAPENSQLIQLENLDEYYSQFKAAQQQLS